MTDTAAFGKYSRTTLCDTLGKGFQKKLDEPSSQLLYDCRVVCIRQWMPICDLNEQFLPPQIHLSRGGPGWHDGLGGAIKEYVAWYFRVYVRVSLLRTESSTRG